VVTDSHHFGEKVLVLHETDQADPYPHSKETLDLDPHLSDADPHQWFNY
jgi:hypothetical protein